MRRIAPSTSGKIIDSRDVIARLEELAEEREDLQTSVEEAEGAVTEARDALDEAEENADTTALEAAIAGAEQELDAARERLTDWDSDNDDELKALLALQDEAEGYADDWRHGATLIQEDYFPEYCQELLADIGDLPRNLPDYLVIDWDATADNLRADYTSVDFDGTTYLIR